MTLSKQMLIGLPETGKTTFLAALWYVLTSGRVPGALRLAEVHGNQTHLNHIRDKWAQCQPLPRTHRGDETEVSMRLEVPDGSAITELVVPDSSGELFEDQWEKGTRAPGYLELAEQASCGLLFVHPGKIHEGLTIRQVTQTASAAGLDLAALPHIEGQIGWEPKHVGTQVQLVEILEMLNRPPLNSRKRRLAVLVSAWDLLAHDHTPTAWLIEALPLLYQYLQMNPEIFQVRVYGISAQGGDIATDSAKLLGETDPWRRIIVDGPCAEQHDITAPIRWLMTA